jgi:hypothetical protein
MSEKRILKISADGSIVEGLHTDMLVGLGSQQIVRASEIEFDMEQEAWTVKLLIGPDAGTYLRHQFAKRSDALAVEREYLNSRIFTGEVGI